MRRSTYTALLYILSPFILLFVALRIIRAPDYRDRWYQRFGFGFGSPQIQPCIWVHAVSVGEVSAATPLVRRLLEDCPDCRIILTTVTTTGYERARAVFGDRVRHAYLPLDFPGAVRRFLRHFQPELAVIMETELWYNLFYTCAKRGVPLVIANARISPRSLKGYRQWRRTVGRVLNYINFAGAQTEQDAERLRELGLPADRIAVTGNLKFDIPVGTDAREQGEALRRSWGPQRPVWVAASTHEGEDELVLDAFSEVRRRIPDALLILVPRHPQRFDAVAALIRQRGFSMARRKQGQVPDYKTAVYLGDTMGELMRFYAAADVAFVGGSLVPIGGHNLLEPAALGVPTVTGPHTFNFSEIYRSLREAGGVITVEGSESLAAEVAEVTRNKARRESVGSAAQGMVQRNQGALERMYGWLQPYLRSVVTESSSLAVATAGRVPTKSEDAQSTKI
ncbi:MAG: lipid IV(A) 3-deoxy-D-manno-octulosonic acid transferase [Pseudomonadota bacterium]|nr:lipid IV(A) 3-deoxy-D-manno-octulosonic acid transferase [Pseudomonadota bacterium]